MIPRLRPALGARELAVLLRPARSDAVPRFEQAFAHAFGAREGVAFAYGRSGLLGVLTALGIQDAEVILPAYTCSVVAHATVLSGNVPRFVDCRLEDYNMDLDQLAEAITSRTRVVVATHLFGYPLDVDRLEAIIDDAEARFGQRILIVQDCAHAFGARWRGGLVAARRDVALFGLNVSKMMTSIFGGMLTTSDDELAMVLRRWCSTHLKRPALSKAALRRLYLSAVHAAFTRAAYGAVYHLQTSTSFLDRFTKAYHLDDAIRLPPDALDRMLDVEAEVGLVQLSRYPVIEAARQRIAQIYDERLRDAVGLVRPPLVEGATYSHYVVRVGDRAAVMKRLAGQGVQLGELIEYSMPHLPAYVPYAGDSSFENALFCSRHTINLPIHASVRPEDAERIADEVARAAAATAA